MLALRLAADAPISDRPHLEQFIRRLDGIVPTGNYSAKNPKRQLPLGLLSESLSTRALAHARENRKEMAKRAIELMSEVWGEPFEVVKEVDLTHNFVRKESWFGRALFIHRKGAVALSQGDLALIPGSMGTASYVVQGLGNEASFGSCSHGAGRVMTRSEARRRVERKQLQRVLRHVVWPEHRARDLVEEAPEVYRDIREVLGDQEDLVIRKVRLEPLAVWKG